jgi:hypothetical protein
LENNADAVNNAVALHPVADQRIDRTMSKPAWAKGMRHFRIIGRLVGTRPACWLSLDEKLSPASETKT